MSILYESVFTLFSDVESRADMESGGGYGIRPYGD
jgi:hypothetical protein